MVHWSLRRQNSWVQLAGHEGKIKQDGAPVHVAVLKCIQSQNYYYLWCVEGLQDKSVSFLLLSVFLLFIPVAVFTGAESAGKQLSTE